MIMQMFLNMKTLSILAKWQNMRILQRVSTESSKEEGSVHPTRFFSAGRGNLSMGTIPKSTYEYRQSGPPDICMKKTARDGSHVRKERLIAVFLEPCPHKS